MALGHPIDTAAEVDVWCDDCEDFWPTRVFGQADRENCPHCRGQNVRVMPPLHEPREVKGLQWSADPGGR